MSSSTAAVSSLILQYCPEFAEEQTATAAAPAQPPSQQQVLQVVKTVFNRAAIVTRLYLDSFEKREKGFVQQWSENLTGIRMDFSQHEVFLSKKLPQKTAHFYHTMQTKEYNHPANTQAMILEGCRGLDPSKAVIVVCGAQFYKVPSGETRFVEPLREMLKYCAQLVLVDQDQETLDTLKQRVNSKKVVTVPYDLSKGMLRECLRYATQLAEEKLQLPLAVARIEKFCQELLAKMMALPLQILPPGKSADFVVSSLVGSEIGHHFALQIKDFMSLLSGGKKETSPWESLHPHLAEIVLQLGIDFQVQHVKDLMGMAKRVYYADKVDRISRESSNPNVVTDSFENDPSRSPVRALWEQLSAQGVVRKWYWVKDETISFKIQALLKMPPLEQDGKAAAT